MADPLLAITAELGEPLMVVGAEERMRWHQPIVYAWIRAEEVLYVGCSWVGTERPLSAKHEPSSLGTGSRCGPVPILGHWKSRSSDAGDPATTCRTAGHHARDAAAGGR